MTVAGNEERYKFTTAWSSYSRISKWCLAGAAQPPPFRSPLSLSVSRVRIYLDSRQGLPSLVCLGWLTALDESDREIYESRETEQGRAKLIGERGKQKKEEKKKMKREEAHPGQEKGRDRVLVSSSHTSPSRFGELAKTLLRFKSVPFGKVPTLPANPPEEFQRSRGIFLKSYVDFLLEASASFS